MPSFATWQRQTQIIVVHQRSIPLLSAELSWENYQQITSYFRINLFAPRNERISSSGENVVASLSSGIFCDRFRRHQRVHFPGIASYPISSNCTLMYAGARPLKTRQVLDGSSFGSPRSYQQYVCNRVVKLPKS